jgi:hypothetical protein
MDISNPAPKSPAAIRCSVYRIKASVNFLVSISISDGAFITLNFLKYKHFSSKNQIYSKNNLRCIASKANKTLSKSAVLLVCFSK